MANLANCPTEAELRDLLLGKGVESVGEHLLDCPRCGANAGRLVASDPLLAELRAANETSEIGTDGTFVEELLRRIKQPSSAKTLPDAELAFLDPATVEFPTDLGMFNHYRIVEKIGEGGMGMVFRAFDSNLQRTVALKIILPKYAANQKLRDRFIEEARATVKVRSPHVAEVYETNVWKDVPYLTMELLVGTTLDKKPRPMAADSLRRIGFSIAKGLSDAHRSGMIHRDLKPSNIHLGTDSRTGKPTVKLIDFGLARPVNRDIEITKSGELLGTPAYMSPEQARGKKVDHRTDLYSLGVILHQLATGHLPYEGADAGVMAILTELATPEPLTSVSTRANLPPALASLIDRLLAKDPANRPGSADEVMKVLKASLGAKADAAGGTEVVESAPYVSISDQTAPPFAELATSPLTAVPAMRATPKRTWLWPAVGVGALLAGVLIAAGFGVFKVKTKDGTIVLTDLPEDAEVLVDDEVTTVTWDAGKQKAEVTVKPGTRTLQVRKDGFRVTGDEITLAEGDRKPFTVRMEKLELGEKPAAVPVAVVPSVVISDELVQNGKAEKGNYQGWEIKVGRWNPMGPNARDPFFRPGNCASALLQQDVPVTDFAADIDAGLVEFKFSGLLSCYGKGQKDKARIAMIFLDADRKETDVAYNTGFVHEPAWKEYGGTWKPKVGTRHVRILLHSLRDRTPGNNECSGYYSNISLKALVRPAANRAAVARAGKFRFAGGELVVEPEAPAGIAFASFGDLGWTDYDLTVEAKGNPFLFARVADTANHWDFEAMPESGGNTCRLRIKSNNTYSTVGETKDVPNAGADGWNKLVMSVRGGTMSCAFNGREVVRHIDARNPRGLVGLGGRGEVRFRNARVSAPDGSVLWAGFPDLDGPAGLIAASATGFVPLFNGKDLAGWKPHPDHPGQWMVNNGILQGKAFTGPAGRQIQSYLRTARKDYADFHLRAEARINRGGSGGIYFRVGDGGEIFPTATDRWITGYKVDIEARGPIPTWTGGLMCGNYILSPPTDSPVQPGEWFVLEVVMSGWDITVKINDRVVNRYNRPDFGHRSAKGFISLEAYGGPSLVEYRKIEIQEPARAAVAPVSPKVIAPPPAAKDFTPLFNGKDLAGWEKFGFPKGAWTVENGELVGTCPVNNNSDGSNLVTVKKDYRHFHLRLQTMKSDQATRKLASRVVFLDGPKDDGVNGYFKVLLGSPDDKEGKEVGRLVREKTEKYPLLATPTIAANAWYTLEIIVQGNRVQVLVDGTKTADVTDNAIPAAGHCLNLTCAQGGTVRFRNIEIRELPANAIVDPFPAGTVWRGVKIIEKGEYAGGTGFYELAIATRNGNAFTGTTSDNGPNRNPSKITGTVNGNNIEWQEVPHFAPTRLTTLTGSYDAGMLTMTTKGTFGTSGNSGRAKLVRVRPSDVGVSEEFHSIFDGRSLAGWETHPSQKEGWTTNQFGKLVGKGNAASYLYTKREYGDVHVFCRAKVNEGGNSGVYVRSTYGPARGAWPFGYEAQIAVGFPNQPTGSLYPFQLGNPIPAAGPDTVKANEWFDLEAIVRGNRVRVLVNGNQTVDYTDPTPQSKSGRIALQLHDAKTEVEFAMLAVKELKP